MIKSIPKKSKAKPRKNSPQERLVLFFEKTNGNDKPIMGKRICEILNFNPKSVINQILMVVPILAPIVTAIESLKVIKPAFTKLTSITVVADDA